MTTKRRQPAYFAVSRGIFEHPLFTHGKRPYSRREAWEWLIAQAAWKPKGHRHVYGVADLARGQLSFTKRELAALWRWPATNVLCFLHRLRQEQMISFVTDYNLTATRPTQRPIRRPGRYVITICNYDRFQRVSQARPDRQSDQYPDQSAPQLPGIIMENLAETLEHQESIAKQEAANKPLRNANNVDKSKPPHGARNRKARVQWFDYNTAEWKAAVEFDREMRGTETYPVRYRDGRGNWFKERGEAEWREWGRRVSGRR